MPILGIMASSVLKVTNSYESIATVTVGSGGSSSISFSSIPSTFKHLQVRGIARGATTLERVALRANGDSGNNYTNHYLYGDGSSTGAGANTGRSNIDVTTIPSSGATANAFGSVVVDILDYTNTNKYKTVRALGGNDNNGSGYSILYSGLWLNTSAITQIDLVAGSVGSGNYAQYSQFALYGIKG